jgi:hypothetical protein
MDQTAKWQATVIQAINRSSDRNSKQILDYNTVPVNTHDQFYREHAERFRRELIIRLHYIEMESRSESVSDAYNETDILSFPGRRSKMVQFRPVS